MNGWRRVSRREPCPICQHGDWCGVSSDGVVCHCMRVESANPCPSGGWFHFLKERPKRMPVRIGPKPPARPRMFNAELTMAGFRAEFEAPGGEKDIFDSLVEVSNDLNLCAADIDRLLVGRSAFHGAWAFPMLDGGGKCVGIRLREYGGSGKWSVGGSRDGLFYDPELKPAETVYNGVRGLELVVVEGATDCIAGYALGLPCVGRSACATGVDALKELCARLGVSRVTIVSDNDDYKFRPDGTPWKPGAEGAQALARRLGRTYRIVTPPKKDLREWYYAGLTAETFWMVADLQPWRRASGLGPVLFPPSAPKTPTIPHTQSSVIKRPTRRPHTHE